MSSTNKKNNYPEVNPQQSFPLLEKEILATWAKNGTFKKSVEIRNASPEFVFFDGPPFANGLPHYGSLLTGFVKDIVPRFQTMRGKKVERRFGWDCHGLPAEMEAEKQLAISGRQQITKFGIDKFNNYCRSSVLKYTSEWEAYVTRQARWVDFKNDYKTMDPSYMESVIWAFKELWNKGLIYEGTRVLPYSWACETPLSNFEIRMDDATHPRQDPALTVAFIGEDGSEFLAWTTTPWTLTSNLALAVNSEINYVKAKKDDHTYILAEAALGKYKAELGTAEILATFKGSELVGKKYAPLFPFFEERKKDAFKVLAADFVSTEDGTGIVHIAPGFGEDDFKVCEANSIIHVAPVDDSGKFTVPVTPYQGQQVHEAQKLIIKDLKDAGRVIRHETIDHNYPHCWRTNTPIIYRAMSSWYVKVTQIKERMIELNKQINWIPAHVRDGQFGRWLENSRDWSISRSRFWGAPIPVWKSDDPKYPRVDVYGSIAEIEKDFGVKLTDLHRPGIDSLTRKNPDDPSGKSTMRRVEDVLDCWFESGSMPFAQVHYPFENKQWFNSHFPADFIVEYIAQTRGWFYTMLVLSTALFDRPPFKNCICHGVLLNEQGQKISKKLKNYTDPEKLFESTGAEALRWYFLASPILKGQDLSFDMDGKCVTEAVRSVINPIWNAYYFFTLYANADGVQAQCNTASPEQLDKYILSKARTLVEGLTSCLEKYELASAAQLVTSFLEALNNWYIRRSRERFWREGSDPQKIAAYNTLYTVLVTLMKALAPLLPMITEKVYTNLTGEESVHLTSWPDVSTFPSEHALESAMDEVRAICSSGLSLREIKNLRTRLPLQKVTIAGSIPAGVDSFSGLIKEELNVKEVVFKSDFSEFAQRQVQVNAKEIGPKLGASMKDVLAATRSGAWKLLPDGSLEIAGKILPPGDFVMKISPQKDVLASSLPSNTAVVVLDTTMTPDLKAEGAARDLVRLVQQARKDAGFNITDRIALKVKVPGEIEPAIRKFEGYISEQTLAESVQYGDVEKSLFSQQGVIEEHQVTLGLDRI
jgi:isoleucyl-tRNA synthetase